MLIQSSVFSSAVVHGFSTADLDLSPQSADWKEAGSFFGEGYGFALVSQVHGDVAIVATEAGLLGNADALICAQAGLVVAIRTADCVPVLVECDGMVAAIHAGWRGIANGIIGKTFSDLSTHISASTGPS